MDSLHTYEPRINDPIGRFESEMEEEHRRQMRMELAGEIDRLDGAGFASAPRTCPKCGGRMHSHGRCGGREYLASCGHVRVRLRRLRCASCGHISVPGAGLVPAGGVSACLAEKMCDLALKTPYAKAADSLGVQHGIRISAKRFWKLVQDEAESVGDALGDEARALYGEGKDPAAADLGGAKPLIIGIDGGHVRGWKGNPSFEVRCATVATGSEPASGGRRKLAGRVGYAADCPVDEFRMRVSALALKSGYMTASERIFVSDGAPWISGMVEGWFPDAVHVLDMYHLKQKVRSLFGSGAEGRDAELRDGALGLCDRYDPQQLAGAIAAWDPPDDAKAAQRDELVSYIGNNAQAIRNHLRVGIHGSGWIEKGVDLMVSRRLKNRGMAWTRRGCSHMLPFTVLAYNRQWGVYWRKRKGLCLGDAA
jgi:hypothetical protein